VVKFRRLRRPARLARRRLVRGLGRRLDRACLRPSRRAGPSDLSQALTAFSRAIRCHRRLARLAPRFFDSPRVEREARAREERRRWMALWEPILAKVYECEPDPVPLGDELPPLPSPSTQRAVERELSAWASWLETGSLALARHQQRHPHRLLSCSQIVRLIRVACDLKTLVFGDAAQDLPSAPCDHRQVWADLERAYGNHAQSAVSPPLSSVPEARSTPTLPSTPPVRHASTAALPPDDRRDLIPYALTRGPHGLFCLQPIIPQPHDDTGIIWTEHD